MLTAARHAGQVLAVAALCAGVGFAGYRGYRHLAAADYFRVADLRVEGARRAPRGELRHLAAPALGRQIFDVDTAALGRRIARHPWVRRATVERRLPDTLVVRVEEEAPAALLLMGHLYLVDAGGRVFKRATPDETAGLPVITGVGRLAYLNDRPAAEARIGRALAALAAYRAQPRPALSEVNVGRDDEITFYLRRGGVAVRLGVEVDGARLRRLDAVLLALGPDARRARAIYLDNEVRADRVVVRMESHD